MCRDRLSLVYSDLRQYVFAVTACDVLTIIRFAGLLSTMLLNPAVIDQLLAQRGLKRRWLYTHLGLYESEGMRTLKGRRDVSPDDAQKLAGLLGVTVAAIAAAEKR